MPVSSALRRSTSPRAPRSRTATMPTTTAGIPKSTVRSVTPVQPIHGGASVAAAAMSPPAMSAAASATHGPK